MKKQKTLIIVGSVVFALYTFAAFLDFVTTTYTGYSSLIAAVLLLISAILFAFAKTEEQSRSSAVWYAISAGFCFVNAQADGRCLGAGVFCLLVFFMTFRRTEDPKQTKAEEAPAPRPVSTAAPVKPQTAAAPAEKGEIRVPRTIQGQKIAYHYQDVELYCPADVGTDLTTIDPGDFVRFYAEPVNIFDKNSIAAYTEKGKIGYLNKGKIRNIVSDFLADELPIWAHVSAIDDEVPLIRLFVALYRNQ